MWTIRSVLSSCASALFPARCFGCTKEGISLCSACLMKCTRAVDTPSLYITTYFSFKDPLIKRAIHAIKYYRRRDLVAPLSLHLASQLRMIPDIETFILVPIPMPSMRKLLRGYNQAELLAEELSRTLGLRTSRTLARTRNTLRQVKTSTRNERINNQRGSFSVTSNISGMNLLLIDDVVTTGATLDEARKMLLKHGASKVLAGTIAH